MTPRRLSFLKIASLAVLGLVAGGLEFAEVDFAQELRARPMEENLEDPVELGRVALDPPIELAPSRGDVLYFHYLCAHASSDSVSGAPCLAINHKW